MNKGKLKLTIEVETETGRSVHSYEHFFDNDYESPKLDNVLQALCYVIPHHEIIQSSKANVIQAFDEAGKIVGHGEF